MKRYGKQVQVQQKAAISLEGKQVEVKVIFKVNTLVRIIWLSNCPTHHRQLRFPNFHRPSATVTITIYSHYIEYTTMDDEYKKSKVEREKIKNVMIESKNK